MSLLQLMQLGLGGKNSRVAVASDFTISLPGSSQTANDTVDFVTANAGWRFDPTGNVDKEDGSWSNDHHTWGSPATAYGSNIGDLFEIKATLNSGSLDSGTTGSWLPFGSGMSEVTWGCTDTSGAQFDGQSCNLTVAIRDIATQTEQDSQTYIILAERDDFI